MSSPACCFNFPHWHISSLLVAFALNGSSHLQTCLEVASLNDRKTGRLSFGRQQTGKAYSGSVLGTFVFWRSLLVLK